MWTFTAALFFLIITPGPGVLSTAGVGAGFGYRAGTRYVIGLFLGNNLVAFLVVTGIAALILADPRVRTILFLISLAYLATIAFRIATAGSRIGFIEKAAPPGIKGGFLLQPINPKAYAVNTTLFTGFPFWPDSYLSEVLVKFLILNAIWTPVHFLWLYMGVTLHRLDLADRTHRVINIFMAVSMMLVVVLAALA